MTDWTEMQKKVDADLYRRIKKLQRMLTIYDRRGMKRQASRIPARICRLKTQMATISLNSFRHMFQKSA